MTEYFIGKYNTSMDSDFYVPQKSLSATTSIQTANQLAEATARLNAGVSGIDISVIDPNLFEQIPKQHFTEINRLMKLSDAKATIHGPIVDLAGFTQQNWSELQRKETEKQMNYFVEMAHELDPKGNTPINFHISTAVPGTQWRKVTEEELKGLQEEDRNKIIKGDEYGMERPELMVAVNRETGQLAPLRYEVKEAPGGEKEVWDPMRRLNSLNSTEWDKEKLEMINLETQKLQLNDRMTRLQNEASILEKNKDVLNTEQKNRLQTMKKEFESYQNNVAVINHHLNSQLTEMFNKLKYVEKEDENKVKKIKENVEGAHNEYKQILEKTESNLKKARTLEEKNLILAEFKQNENQYIELLRDSINQAPAPKLWQPSNDVAHENTVKTVANAAFSSYEKFRENSPIIVLENYQPDLVLGRASQLAKVVEETRNKFAQRLVNEKYIDSEMAKEVANKLIGVTWDVGHINFMRKAGYSQEEILQETKNIAPYVKQVHITDNFGFNDAHLPPGMGNAPIREELKILEKAGFNFDKGNVIVEAGAYVAQMKENPQGYIMDYFKSPLYEYKPPFEAARPPYWPQIWEQETIYGVGYGDTLPELHFKEFYGSSFSNLPKELGGQIGGDKSRFAGTPNQ